MALLFPPMRALRIVLGNWWRQHHCGHPGWTPLDGPCTHCGWRL